MSIQSITQKDDRTMNVTMPEKESYQRFLTNPRYAKELEKDDPETFKRFLLNLAKYDPEFLLNSGELSQMLIRMDRPLYRQLKEEREKRRRGEL